MVSLVLMAGTVHRAPCRVTGLDAGKNRLGSGAHRPGTWLQRDRKPREGDHLGESVEPVAAGRVADGRILDLTRPREQVEYTEVKPAVLEDRHPPAKPDLQPGGHLGKHSVPRTSLHRPPVHDGR